MMYIASALQTFEELGPQKRKAIALEIAMLGRNGLDINDPDDNYTLKSLPGKFSGLRLLAIMYTAFHQIDPTMDTGADFSAEFKAATELQLTQGGWAARPGWVALRPVAGAHAHLTYPPMHSPQP